MFRGQYFFADLCITLNASILSDMHLHTHVHALQLQIYIQVYIIYNIATYIHIPCIIVCMCELHM